MFFKAVIILVVCISANGIPTRNPRANDEELGSPFWFNKGQNILQQQLQKKINTNIAKNVILFLGDGMSISTVTTARILQGQSKGGTGEENSLFFETFPASGLSHTYCVDYSVPDSACTATAYLGGVKGNKGTVGVTAAVKLDDCEAMADVNNHVHSIGKWAQDAGKATGIVTVTKLTDGSPAGVYSHTANRDWENDANVLDADVNVVKCPDIAQQMITGETGPKLNVIMGGGRNNFLPKDQGGDRVDNEDLVALWQQLRENEGVSYRYVKEKQEFLSLTPTDYLLGIFAKNDMHYNLQEEPDEPTLSEMTERAIINLQANPNGYFLFVEGGNIDNAHHDNQANRALNETVEFDNAIRKAVELTNEEDTLIVVTADHAHTMTFNGYPHRGSSPTGFGGDGSDNLPYTSVSYANGPGYKKPNKGDRPDLSKDDLTDQKYNFPATVPLNSATHNGEDVVVFARGPWSHLFVGSYEENYIPYAMGYASCIGKGLTVCNSAPRFI